MFAKFVKMLPGPAMLAVTGFMANIFLVTSATATIWNIDEVLTGGSGFSASLFHSASSSNAMSGTVLETITGTGGMLGTFNDVTGAFSSTLSVTGLSGPTFSLSGSGLIFGAGGFGTLASNGTLTVNFAGDPLNGAPSGTVLGLKKGFVCCGTSGNDPNSFFLGNTTSAIMTLWGADGFDINNGTYSNSIIGMDLRLSLSVSSVSSTIPLPAALPLFAAALWIMGFAGWRKKQNAVA